LFLDGKILFDSMGLKNGTYQKSDYWPSISQVLSVVTSIAVGEQNSLEGGNNLPNDL